MVDPEAVRGLSRPGFAFLRFSSGMADRGNGIRMFNSKAALEKIFEESEESDSDDDSEHESVGEENKTAVVASQLRHFVIQVPQIEGNFRRLISSRNTSTILY
jgi:hypothetical protein